MMKTLLVMDKTPMKPVCHSYTDRFLQFVFHLVMYLYDELYHVLVSNIFCILIKFWKISWQVSLVSFHIPPLKTILFESIILYCKFYELISIWWRYHRLWVNPNDACFCHSYTDRESFIHCSIYSAHHLSSHRELFILL